MYECTYVRMYVRTYVPKYVCAYVRMYMCACTHVCMYVCCTHVGFHLYLMTHGPRRWAVAMWKQSSYFETAHGSFRPQASKYMSNLKL